MSAFTQLFEFKIKVPKPVLDRVQHFVLGEWAFRLLPKIDEKIQHIMAYPQEVRACVESMEEVASQLRKLAQKPSKYEGGFVILPISDYSVGAKEADFEWDHASFHFQTCLWSVEPVEPAQRLEWTQPVEYRLNIQTTGTNFVLHTTTNTPEDLASEIDSHAANFKATAQHNINDGLIRKRTDLTTIRARLQQLRDQGDDRRRYRLDLPVNQVIVTQLKDFAGWDYTHLLPVDKKQWLPPQFAVQVQATINQGGEKASGLWVNDPAEQLPWIGYLVVSLEWHMDLETPTELQQHIEDLMDTCEHEVRHGLQFWLQKEAKLGDLFGMPPRHARTPEHDPSGAIKGTGDYSPEARLAHPFRDIEFYTNLSQYVNSLTRALGSLDPKLRRNAFRTMVGLSSGLNHGHPNYRTIRWQASPIGNLVKLKQDMPNKWKHYVNLLYQEMQRLNLL